VLVSILKSQEKNKMQSNEENGLIIARFFTDEDIFQSLDEVCRKHNVKTAAIVSGIGQLRQCTVGYFNGTSYEYHEIPQTHELLSLSGLATWEQEDKGYKYHLHAALSNQQTQAVGGHLVKGTVEGTNEIVMIKSGIMAHRKKDEKTGLQGLYLED
jgi:uncharacterized protein